MAALVVKQTIAANTRDKDICETVVIVIANRNTHPVEIGLQARLSGNVLELSASIIAIQCQRWRRSLFALPPGPIRAADKEQILVAISIVIEKSDTAAHRFRQKFLSLRAIVMLKAHAGFGGDVLEAGFRHFGKRSGWNLGHAQVRDLFAHTFPFVAEINHANAADDSERDNRDDRPAESAVEYAILGHFFRLTG